MRPPPVPSSLNCRSETGQNKRHTAEADATNVINHGVQPAPANYKEWVFLFF